MTTHTPNRYTLHPDNDTASVQVDDVTLTKTGGPVALTASQADRLGAVAKITRQGTQSPSTPKSSARA